MPAASVVLCTVNRPDLIGQAVASILNCELEDFELIVVDQSPDSRTRDALNPIRERDNRLRYIHSERVGLSAAYNTGIRESCAPVIAFTDDDCVVPTDWLRRVVETFAINPDVELVYGQVLVPDDVSSTDGVIPALEFATQERLSNVAGFRVCGMGANFAARRSLFDRVGPFDEVLGGGGPLRSSQDFDLQFRAYRFGVVCLLEPSVRVFHYGLRTADQWPATLRAYGTGDGGFYMKHVRCGDRVALRLLVSRLAGQTVRVVVKPLLGRKHSSAYLAGLIAGIWGSYGYQVDRPSRMYRSSSPPGGSAS